MSELLEPSATYFQECAVDPAGTLCLRASSETLIDVVNVATGSRIALHRTNFSFGGQRLAITNDTRHFITGGWDNPAGGGVACYDTLSGECLWHNRKLKRPQILAYEPTTDSWFVSLDHGGTFLIDRLSGEPQLQIRGSFRRLLGHDKSGNCFIDEWRAPNIDVINPRTGAIEHTVSPATMWEWVAGKLMHGLNDRVMMASFRSSEYQNIEYTSTDVVASCAFGDSLLLACVAGSLRNILIDNGSMLWEVLPPLRSHFFEVAIDRTKKIVWALTNDPEPPHEMRLWGIDLSTGRIVTKAGWPATPYGKFVNAGQLYVDGTGAIEMPSTQVQRFE